MSRNYTAVADTSTCFVLNLTILSVESSYRNDVRFIVCNVSCDAIDFSSEIARDAELKREFEASDNEALFRPQTRACFSTVGTRTEKAPW